MGGRAPGAVQPINSLRVVLTFVNVDVEVAGELWQCAGCRPTARLAGLAAEAARRGHQVTLHFGTEATTEDVARAIARTGPQLVVLEEDERVRTIVAAVRSGLDAPSIVVADAGPAHHAGDPEGLLAELARRGLAPAGPPREGSGPYELGLVPVRSAPEVGIECSYRDPSGATRRHPAETVARELHAVDTVRNDGATVLLHDAVTGPAGDTLDWWRVLAGEFQPRHVRPAVRGPLEALDEIVCDQLRGAGVRQVVAEAWPFGWAPGDVEARLRPSAERRRPATSARVDGWRRHFGKRCREVVCLPYDRTTAASERMLPEELGEETRAASERLAELAAGAAAPAQATPR